MALPRESTVQRPEAEKGQDGRGWMTSGLYRQGGQGGERAWPTMSSAVAG